MQAKVLQNAPRGGAFCNTFDGLSLRPLFCLFLSGHLRQVLLYLKVAGVCYWNLQLQFFSSFFLSAFAIE